MNMNSGFPLVNSSLSLKHSCVHLFLDSSFYYSDDMAFRIMLFERSKWQDPLVMKVLDWTTKKAVMNGHIL
jgi:hypothetical protein